LRGVRPDHRQEGIRREGRGLVSVRIDDGRVSHRVLRSTSATLLDIKISCERPGLDRGPRRAPDGPRHAAWPTWRGPSGRGLRPDRKSTRLNSSHVKISYAVFCLRKKNARNNA